MYIRKNVAHGDTGYGTIVSQACKLLFARQVIINRMEVNLSVLS